MFIYEVQCLLKFRDLMLPVSRTYRLLLGQAAAEAAFEVVHGYLKSDDFGDLSGDAKSLEWHRITAIHEIGEIDLMDVEGIIKELHAQGHVEITMTPEGA